MDAETQQKNVTVRLVRGRVYYYKNERFEKGKDVKVTSDLADELESLAITRFDRDGEKFDKPRFRIVRPEEAEDDEEDEPTPRRRGRKPSRANSR